MIGPEEIIVKAEKWWPEVLRAHLEGEDYFPKEIPRIGKGNKAAKPADFDRLQREQNALRKLDGKGYTLHWKTVNSRTLGSNQFVERITIDSLEDYLQLTDKRAAYTNFATLLVKIRGKKPELESWLKENPLEILEQADAWPDLLKVLDYFQTSHEAYRYYIRELPIAVPTKFIENHRRVLVSLLDTVLPEEAIKQEFRGVKNFERRYGLKYAQPLVRLLLLDEEIAKNYFNGVNDLSLPLDQFAALQLPLRRIIIVENKTNYRNIQNFLTLPEWPATAGVFGSGFRAGNLKSVTWLNKMELYYWGDLDAHGLQIVNQLRSYFPHLRTLLMDRKTLQDYADYHVGATPAATVELPYLSPEELELYDYLNDNRIRLEQERIDLARVRAAFAEGVAKN